MLVSTICNGRANQVSLKESQNGVKLQVNGSDFFVKGMNWDYFPIGTNFSHSLWKQPESLIKTALDNEMALLKNMGVNTIRVYTGIPKKWITYIYENYGIYTMLNHSFGRYGLTIEGELLDANLVRSSIARRLGMDVAGLVTADRYVDGVVEMMLDATLHYQPKGSMDGKPHFFQLAGVVCIKLWWVPGGIIKWKI